MLERLAAAHCLTERQPLDACRTLSHDPLALDPNCIHIVDAQVFKGSTYHLVASDDNDFNALLPAWGIREAYIGAGNTLANVRHRSLQHTATRCS